ncbi:MAG: BamA/TamA family outer membrane protein [Deltaproteobacteria bacterium]|nr:BamA/TamA family outer membrane protein [Deltaproteobacteria bacterium]
MTANIRIATTLVVALLSAAAPAVAKGAPEAPQQPDATEPQAQEVAEEPKGDPAPPDEPTAADVSKAPRPHHDPSGIEGGQQGVPDYLWAPRIALYPVRGLLELTMAPLRGLIFVEQKYAIKDRLVRFFFTEDENFGVYPTAFAETGFGFNIGLRMVWKQMFGSQAALKARGGYGGQFQRLIGVDWEMPISKRVSIEAFFLAEDRPRDRFFGIGNSERVDIDTLPIPGSLDAIDSDVAIGTRFSEELIRSGFRLAVALPRSMGLAVDSSYVHRRYGEAENTSLATGGLQDSVEEAYDTTTIPGFTAGVDYIYSELEFTLDTRRKTSRFAVDPMPGTGWYVEAYAGFAESVNNDITSFYRYGFDAQRYIRIAQNPRTLVLRAHLEGVTGTLDEVPFTELPRLGGPVLLRGYRQDRFRDRVRGLMTAEYQWDLSNMIAGFVYTDVGQVFRSYESFEFDETRIAFGTGIQLHTASSYIGRFLVGSSTDGSLLVNLSFDPAFDIQNRTLVK